MSGTPRGRQLPPGYYKKAACLAEARSATVWSPVAFGRIGLVGVLLLAGSFGLVEYAQRTGHRLEEARTIAVNTFVFGEMFYLFNCRSLTAPSWRVSLRTNHFVL